MPDDYRIAPAVFQYATRYGVNIGRATLDSFSKREIARLSLCYMAPAIAHEPKCIFLKSIEDAIGESQTANQDLVPRSLLEFGEGR